MKNPKAKPPAKPARLNSDEKLLNNFRSALEKLEASAASGSEKAAHDLNFFRWKLTRDLMTDMGQKAKAGQIGWPPAIRTILEMADFAIPLLLWLAEHQRENIKTYARERWAWPGYFHLSKREQAKYQALLPEFDQTGKEITKASPIELGKKIGLKLNANLTKGDYLFRAAAHAVNDVVQMDKTRFGLNWHWLRAHHKPLLKCKGKAYLEGAEKFILSRGKFTRQNWTNWKPVFETYLTWHYAPPEIKFQVMPKDDQSNLMTAYQTGTHSQWFENHRMTHPMSAVEETQFLEDMKKSAIAFNAPKSLQTVDQPEIREVIAGRKTQQGQWNALKKELLNRIENLAPAL